MLHLLQSMDRRWIYLLLSVVLIVALIVGKPVKPVVLPSVQQLYDVIEAAPAGPEDGKIILIGTTFAANTVGENGNQARAIIRHLMMRQKRFAVMAVGEPVGAEIGRIIPASLAKRYGYEYGRDWIAFGYQLNNLAFYKSFPLDIQKTIKVDAVNHKPLGSYEIMQGIKTVQDNVALHVELSASSSLSDWLMIVQPMTRPRLKIGYGCTGVMATEAYPYLDSGQLVGMLPGLKGAADYEQLVDELEMRLTPGLQAEQITFPSIPRIGLYHSARHLMFAQNAAHILIILLIILGNVGMFLMKRQPKPAAKEAAND